jgi:hypothetical protein
LNLYRKKRSANNNLLLNEQIQKIRNLRKELGTYAIKQARSEENGLVIISAIVCRKEEVHFIIRPGNGGAGCVWDCNSGKECGYRWSFGPQFLKTICCVL